MLPIFNNLEAQEFSMALSDLDVLIVCSRVAKIFLGLLLSFYSIQVGAGPVGLITALALAKNGVSIRIIDKRTNFIVGQRGPGITVSIGL
jgi:ribulose 1,5-bisphosphate synthetase/thiazole synthase